MMINRRNSMNHPVYASQRIKERYPQIYDRMTPHVNNMVEQIGPRRNFSRADLHRYSQQVVRNSRVMEDPPYGLNGRAFRDIAGVLLLAALLG